MPVSLVPGMNDDSRRKWRMLRWAVAAVVLAAGLVVFAEGAYLETRNPRSNDEDNTALCILAMGSSMIGAGISIPFARPVIVILVAAASPFVAFSFAVFIVWCVLPLYFALKSLIAG